LEYAHLILQDGDTYTGRWFGHMPPAAKELPDDPAAALSRTVGAQPGRRPAPSAPAASDKIPAGEVIFNTGMSGYHEILTDPSYYGQIVVMTYPHIGNYGTDESWTEYGSGGDETLGRLKTSALVVHSLYEGPVPEGRLSLSEFLAGYKTTGLTDVDTRRLTLHIREAGSPNGVIVRASGPTLPRADHARCIGFLEKFPAMEGRNLVSDLSLPGLVEAGARGGPHIALVDCGVKAGIVRELTELGCRLSLVPNSWTAEQIVGVGSDAVLYSNGPGDPGVLSHLVGQLRLLLGRLPVFGICLGHQVIGLALGAERFKMKFGHHGVNNPVRDELTGKVLITSQNHGFAINEETLPESTRIWFRNANDRTNEGILDEARGVWSVQFHPESAPGPRDSLWIFERFIEAV
jgi:carbamoyl-phosphate synthase small subunit